MSTRRQPRAWRRNANCFCLCAKDLYDDWEGMARTGVALLRMQAVENPDDPRLAAIVGRLSVGYPQFRQWWADPHVAGGGQGTKAVHHPEVGALTFDWDSFQPVGVTDQHITIWTPAAGSPTDDKLRILSSWIAASRALAHTDGSTGLDKSG